MCSHSIYNLFYEGEIVFYYIEDNFCVNIEIVVSNNISHSHHPFPIYFRILKK